MWAHFGSDFVFKIFSQSSHIFSPERNWHQKSWTILEKFNSWMMDLTKTTVLPNGFSWLSVNFSIQKLKFCKVVQFFVSFSHERKSERIERRLKTQNLNLCPDPGLEPFCEDLELGIILSVSMIAAPSKGICTENFQKRHSNFGGKIQFLA